MSLPARKSGVDAVLPSSVAINLNPTSWLTRLPTARVAMSGTCVAVRIPNPLIELRTLCTVVWPNLRNYAKPSAANW